LKEGLASGTVNEALSKANGILAEPTETETMRDLLEEARIAGEETDRLFGVRNVGYFRRDIDLTGTEWFKKQVIALNLVSDPGQQTENLKDLLFYEDPGEGGFYDDAGVEGKQPHLIAGESLSSPGEFAKMLDPANRASANTFAFNLEGPVVFLYRGLDQEADYRLKVTLVGVRMPAIMAQEFGMKGEMKLSQDILADEEPVAEGVPISIYTAQQFEFDVPRKATLDGEVRLTFQGNKNPGGFSASVVSEVWLIKKL